MKALLNMERIPITNELMLLLLKLYEFKGKSYYYDRLFKRDAASFEKKTIEQNLIALAKIFNLKITANKVGLIAKKEAKHKTKDEALLINIKQALTQLHDAPESFELLVNEVGNLCKMLSKNYEKIEFSNIASDEQGILLKKKKDAAKDSLDLLMRLFEKQLKEQKYELTQLIANFYVDFMNMNILTTKNDLVALILMYALLLRSFNVFRYIPFFEFFNLQRTQWDLGLVSANYYWESGFAQADMLSRILIQMLLSAYDEIERIAHEYDFEKSLNKSDNLENTIMKLPELFTKEDLRHHHQNVSDATIDRTLKRLKEENKIRPLGKGRSTKWQRIVKGNLKKGVEQLSFFD
jgi:hypothetical protein